MSLLPPIYAGEEAPPPPPSLFREGNMSGGTSGGREFQTAHGKVTALFLLGVVEWMRRLSTWLF